MQIRFPVEDKQNIAELLIIDPLTGNYDTKSSAFYCYYFPMGKCFILFIQLVYRYIAHQIRLQTVLKIDDTLQ